MKKFGGKKRAKDWVGLEVITTRAIATGVCILPAGSRCKVTGAFGGLDLTGPPCGTCGVRVFIRRASYHSVKPAPADPPPLEGKSEAVTRLVEWAEKAVPLIKPDAPLRWYKNDRVRDELKKAIEDVRAEPAAKK